MALENRFKYYTDAANKQLRSIGIIFTPLGTMGVSRVIPFVVFLGLSVAVFSSCNNNGNQGRDNENTSMDSANALNRTKFSGSQSVLDNAQLLMTFYANRLYEIKASAAVLQHSGNPHIKKLADTISRRDKALRRSVDSLAERKNISLPAALSDSQESSLQRLREGKGTTFDADYVRQTIQSHKNDIALLHQATDNSSDTDIARWAEQVIPKMESSVNILTGYQDKLDSLQIKHGFQ
jgi:putative membrane protein